MAQDRHILSLSELNASVKAVISGQFPGNVWVAGEISEIKVNPSGHCYMELIEKGEKEDQIIARSRAMIWATKFRMLRSYFETTTGYPLGQGMKILVHVRPEFHEVYGFSLNIRDMDPTYTLGDQEKKRLEVIRKLREDGVFNMNKEVEFPLVPHRIAVISSETAAGYRDFMDQLLNNDYGYGFGTVLFQSVMQGDQAVDSMIGSLKLIFARDHDFDAVVIIRGGGSRADLSCFDDYELASYIAQLPLPVLTGIGHEQDESIADLVAHKNFKTPTAVAEYLVACVLGFETRLNGLQDRFVLTVRNILLTEGNRISMLEQEFRNRLQREMHELKTAVAGYESAMTIHLKNFFNMKRATLKTYGEVCKRIDPENVLKMGYSITTYKGRTLTDAGLPGSGDRITTRLRKGELNSTVD